VSNPGFSEQTFRSADDGAADTVLAYRWFNVIGDGTAGSPYRFAPYVSGKDDVECVWQPGQNMVAKCIKGYSHQAPEPTCSCGIYGSLSADELAKYRGEGAAFAIFELGGEVIGGTRGYRGQVAVVRGVFLLPDDFRAHLVTEGKTPATPEVLAALAADYGIRLLDPGEAALDPEELRPVVLGPSIADETDAFLRSL
jgi:hypothetical protein